MYRCLGSPSCGDCDMALISLEVVGESLSESEGMELDNQSVE